MFEIFKDDFMATSFLFWSWDGGKLFGFCEKHLSEFLRACTRKFTQVFFCYFVTKNNKRAWLCFAIGLCNLMCWGPLGVSGGCDELWPMIHLFLFPSRFCLWKESGFLPACSKGEDTST